MDNIIYAAESLYDRLEKLEIVLPRFIAFNISITPTKMFLNYL